MTTIHTELPQRDVPGHFGESVAAEWVASHLDDQHHVWFNVGWESFNEIDQILLVPQIGTFVLEVKGGPIDHVHTHTKFETVFGNGKSAKPATQARLAAQQFGAWLVDSSAFNDKNHSPWINHIVWWPQISRADWNTKFSDPALIEESQSMLFTEDMQSAELFQDRLRHALQVPLRGAPGPAKANSDEYFPGVIQALSISMGKLEISEYAKENILKPKKESQKIAALYPYGRPWEVVFRGEPGTGKTQLLLEVGKLHAQSGAKVLYVCYNKTLAADIRRQVQTLGKASLPAWNMRVNDLFDLYKIETVGLVVKPRKGFDTQPFLDAILQQEPSERTRFDTVLIDEAQDLDDVAVQFIMKLLSPEGSFFVSYGNGQELYLQSEPTQMNKILEEADLRQLRRNFRQSANSFLVGQSFYEQSPTIEAGKTWIDEKITISENAKKAQTGVPTPLDVFKVEPINGDNLVSTLGFVEWSKTWAAHAAALELSRILARSASLGQIPDVMLLFPDDKTQTRRRIVEYLEHQQIPYIDFVEVQNRRTTAQEGDVRLVTYHSARGLTARHVIVCDFESLDNKATWNENLKLQRTLGNIILSRASEETVVLSNQEIPSPHAQFVKSISTYTAEIFEARNTEA